MFYIRVNLVILGLAACVCMQGIQQLQVTASSIGNNTAPSFDRNAAPSDDSSFVHSTDSNTAILDHNHTEQSTDSHTRRPTTKVSEGEMFQNLHTSSGKITDYSPFDNAVRQSVNLDLTLEKQHVLKQNKNEAIVQLLEEGYTSYQHDCNTTRAGENGGCQKPVAVSYNADLANSSSTSFNYDTDKQTDEQTDEETDEEINNKTNSYKSISSLPEQKEPSFDENTGRENSQNGVVDSNVLNIVFDSVDQMTVELGGQTVMVCKKNMCGDRCANEGLHNNDNRQSLFRGDSQNDMTWKADTSSMPNNHVDMRMPTVHTKTMHGQSTYNSLNSNPYSQEAQTFGNNVEELADPLNNLEQQPETNWTNQDHHDYNYSNEDSPNSPTYPQGLEVERPTLGCLQLRFQPNCFCDELCVIYGDCCADVFQSCFRLNGTDDVLRFISNIRAFHSGPLSTGNTKTPTKAEKNAENIFIELVTCENISNSMKVFLVSQCPGENRHQTLGKQCENSSFNLPPVSVAFAGRDVAFKNVFCAQCHSVTTLDMTAWSTKITCNFIDPIESQQRLNLSTISELVKKGRCELSFLPPENMCKIRQCDLDSRLNKQQQQQLALNTLRGVCSEADAIFCQTYVSTISGFKNVHCMKCLDSWSWQIRNKSQDITCIVDGILSESNDKTMAKPSYSGGILIILDITGAYSRGSDNSKTSYICQDAEVFDPLTSTCRTLICPPWSKPYRGRCEEVSDTQSFEGTSQLFPDGWTSLVFRIKPERETDESCGICVTLFNATNVCDKTGWISTPAEQNHLNQDMTFFSWSPDCYRLRRKEGTKFEYHVTQLLLRSLESGVDLVSGLTEWITQMATSNLESGSYEMVISNRINFTTPWPRCPDGSTPNLLHDFTMAANSSIQHVKVNISSHEVVFPYKNVGLEFSLRYLSANPDNFTITQTVAVCDISWLFFRANCSTVQYWRNETLQNGSRLTVLASQRHYNYGDFQVQGDVVLVCSDFKQVAITVGSRKNLPYIVLSWLFTILSSIFLLLMLTLYWLLPELCTLPGKMTASLAATMMLTFLSNSFTLLDLHHDYVCPIVAALSHVFTLAHYGWMSAIAVNMASTFGPQSNFLARPQTDHNVFRRYSLVVWGTSLVLVMTSVILDLTHTDDPPTNSHNRTTSELSSEYPRYGYPFCTWFSGPLWTRLAFIIIPYFITFIVSLIGFILTLVGIQQASKTSEKLSKNTSERARCLIYIKLSSAMGFSWIISVVVNIYPETEVLPYIYVCLVLLQGVLLFMSFMANHRVYSLVQKRFKSSSDSFSKSGSTQSSVIMSRY